MKLQLSASSQGTLIVVLVMQHAGGHEQARVGAAVGRRVGARDGTPVGAGVGAHVTLHGGMQSMPAPKSGAGYSTMVHWCVDGAHRLARITLAQRSWQNAGPHCSQALHAVQSGLRTR